MNTAINSNNTDNIYSKRYEMLQHYKKEIADKKWTKLNLLLVGFKEIPQIEYKDLTLKYMEDNLYTCKGGAIVARNVVHAISNVQCREWLQVLCLMITIGMMCSKFLHRLCIMRSMFVILA
ncbi:D-alanine-D-alanine ligase [Acrasis kona]|uniref:D-alanine-D-alanine ligase n=1 Tax=Acrasis kona TaxID=1008807 RepID=A0AAW2ZAJ7_9EUKA